MPTHKPHSALDIARAGQAQADTPERKRFARLLGQIEAARQRLAAWQEHLPAFAAAHQAQVGPIRARLAAARRAWAFELEQLLLKGKWSKAERQTLSRLICELALADLDDPAADPERLALHDRHADVDHATGQQQQLDAMKAMLEDVGDIDLGDGPVDSFDELLQRARQQMAQRVDERDRHERDRHERDGQSPAGAAPRPRRRSASEKRADADAQRVSQTVRAVYRKLAAALHPDRGEPGATPEQRAQSHEQMARANAAYEAGDLLTLLSLQLQIEQVDLARAATLAAEQVRHFNRVLAEQLREIEAEIAEREMALLTSYDIEPTNRPHPEKLGSVLKDAVRAALSAEAALAHDQRTLRGDAAAVKRFLKQLAAEYRFEDSMDGPLPF
jgi:hypothetical protein